MKIRGVIFDIDGTLINSNRAHATAWADVFQEHGFNISVDSILPLIGMGGDKLIPELTQIDPESEQGKEISKRRTEIFLKTYLPHLEAFPKSRELLQYLKSKQIERVIATSAKKEELKALLKQTGLEGLFDEKTSSSDAENSKPDPDIVQAAIQKLDFPNQELVMIGDTPYDVAAAKQAGIPCIGVKCGGWDQYGLNEAIEIYEDPEDLLLHIEESYIFSKKERVPSAPSP